MLRDLAQIRGAEAVRAGEGRLQHRGGRADADAQGERRIVEQRYRDRIEAAYLEGPAPKLGRRAVPRLPTHQPARAGDHIEPSGIGSAPPPPPAGPAAALAPPPQSTRHPLPNEPLSTTPRIDARLERQPRAAQDAQAPCIGQRRGTIDRHDVDTPFSPSATSRQRPAIGPDQHQVATGAPQAGQRRSRSRRPSDRPRRRRAAAHRRCRESPSLMYESRDGRPGSRAHRAAPSARRRHREGARDTLPRDPRGSGDGR